MVLKKDIDTLRLELSTKCKNGIDFIIAAAIIWSLIAFVWTLPYGATFKGFITFFIGTPMLPLAWVFSKILKTTWTIESNPLQPLGLWLNFAQLFYFPFLIFIYMRHPENFVMVYVIITGAHFFPYSWFYKTKAYAVMAGIISAGAGTLGLILPAEKVYLIPVFMVLSLLVLLVWLTFSYGKNRQRYEQVTLE